MIGDIDKSLAIVFPGQGSQSVGMLADLADTDFDFTTAIDYSGVAGLFDPA